ncbi:MAG: hypothetical protein ACLFNQ_06775 [Spirochaetaceae bacterium]
MRQQKEPNRSAGNRVFKAGVAQMTAVLVMLFMSVGFPVVGQTSERVSAVGLQLLEERVEDGVQRFVLQTEDGQRIDVRNDREAELSEQQVAIVDLIATITGNLRTLDVDRLTITFSGNVAEIALIPSRFVYDGVNLLPNVPAGLRFRFDQVLEYDFRVRVGEFFIRLQGQYVDEEQFASRVVRAVRDPVAFLDSLRPEIVADRLNELDSLTEALTGMVDELQADVERLSEENQRLNELVQEQAVQNGALLAELEVLRTGALAVANQSFFGRLRSIDPELVAAVISIKEENPALTQDEVSSALSDQGISASRSELAAVLAVYFGEIE